MYTIRYLRIGDKSMLNRESLQEPYLSWNAAHRYYHKGFTPEGMRRNPWMVSKRVFPEKSEAVVTLMA